MALEFHMCAINKSVHWKKKSLETYLMIHVHIRSTFIILLEECNNIPMGLSSVVSMYCQWSAFFPSDI